MMDQVKEYVKHVYLNEPPSFKRSEHSSRTKEQTIIEMTRLRYSYLDIPEVIVIAKEELKKLKLLGA